MIESEGTEVVPKVPAVINGAPMVLKLGTDTLEQRDCGHPYVLGQKSALEILEKNVLRRVEAFEKIGHPAATNKAKLLRELLKEVVEEAGFELE